MRNYAEGEANKAAAHEWPRITQISLQSFEARIAGAASLGSFLITGDLGWRIRIFIAVLIVAALVLGWWLLFAWKALLAARHRISEYPRIHQHVRRVEGKLDAVTELIEIQNDALAAWMNLLPHVAVVGVKVRDGVPRFIVGSSNDDLKEGERLLIADVVTGELRGEVTISSTTATGYEAVTTTVYAPLWWGFVNDQAQIRSDPPNHTTALRLERP